MSSKVVAISPNNDGLRHQPSTSPTRQDVRKLSSALVISLNIAPGKALVLSLGHGQEASNYEAVESWVWAMLAREQLPAGRQALQILLPALESRLHTIAEKLPQL